MSENKTLARPYAKALFNFATEENQTQEWSTVLGFCEKVVAYPLVGDLLKNPQYSRDARVQFFLEIIQDLSKALIHSLHHAKAFFNLLGQSDRLNLLPEIALMFDEILRETQKTIKVKVLSAKALTEPQIAGLKQALKRRLSSDIIIDADIDESLLGGAVIQAGDTVIDGSVRGKLLSLQEALNL